MMIAGDGDAIIPFDKMPHPFRKKTRKYSRQSEKCLARRFCTTGLYLHAFMANPDTLGCRQVIKGLKNKPANERKLNSCPGWMQRQMASTSVTTALHRRDSTSHHASRQATHIYHASGLQLLESVFAEDAPTHAAPHATTYKTLPENSSEIAVTTGQSAQ
ncbi:MAG: hypothetical protein R3E61_05180 [Pseudomonadales bacterium]